MTACLFCKIINGDIAANIIFRDEKIIAFDDIAPKAPHHKLIIPLKHIATLNDLQADEIDLAGCMLKKAADLAATLGIAETGYRIIMNCNAGAGQTVFHLHLHLLGGRPLFWPPG